MRYEEENDQNGENESDIQNKSKQKRNVIVKMDQTTFYGKCSEIVRANPQNS